MRLENRWFLYLSSALGHNSTSSDKVRKRFADDNGPRGALSGLAREKVYTVTSVWQEFKAVRSGSLEGTLFAAMVPALCLCSRAPAHPFGLRQLRWCLYLYLEKLETRSEEKIKVKARSVVSGDRQREADTVITLCIMNDGDTVD